LNNGGPGKRGIIARVILPALLIPVLLCSCANGAPAPGEGEENPGRRPRAKGRKIPAPGRRRGLKADR